MLRWRAMTSKSDFLSYWKLLQNVEMASRDLQTWFSELLKVNTECSNLLEKLWWQSTVTTFYASNLKFKVTKINKISHNWWKDGHKIVKLTRILPANCYIWRTYKSQSWRSCSQHIPVRTAIRLIAQPLSVLQLGSSLNDCPYRN